MITIEITYNAHRYGDHSDTPKTMSRKFTAPGTDIDNALALFYYWRTEQNEKALNYQRKTYVGMLTSKCIVDIDESRER